MTRMGVETPVGHNPDEYYDNLLKGVSGISEIESFNCSNYPTIKSFTIDGMVKPKLFKRLDKFILYMLTAGKKALADGGLTEDGMEEINKTRRGVLIGSGMGGMKIVSDAIEALQVSYKKMTPFCVPFSSTNIGSSLLGIDLGWMGPTYSISTACATSNFCILNAANHIIDGDASVVTPLGVGGFVACKALSEQNSDPTKASRPWDSERDGFVMGEGAGVLLLEELELAKKRGANIYAEVLAGSFSSDAYHMTQPHPEAVQAMGQGLTVVPVGASYGPLTSGIYELIQDYWDKEEQMKKAEEEARLLAITKPEVIKVVQEEAEKIRLDPKTIKGAKVGEVFKKAQDVEHEVLKRKHNEKVKKSLELRKHKYDSMWTISSRLKPEPIYDIKIHPKTKPVVITIYKGTDGRNFDVHKPFAFGEFGISDLDELGEIIPKKKNTVVKDLMNSLARRKKKHMELELETKIPGLECNQALSKNVSFVNNMVIKEREYGIFFTDVFGDQAFQRWSDIDRVGMEALVSYLVAASMVKSSENRRFSIKLKKLIAEHPDQEKL
ncbi:3-oxoacyl-[acyl-carrier-protein] synthase II, chloroplastic-like protein [Tanacetum coccineum]